MTQAETQFQIDLAKAYRNGYDAAKKDMIDLFLAIIDYQEQEWGYHNGKIVSERIRARVMALADSKTQKEQKDAR